MPVRFQVRDNIQKPIIVCDVEKESDPIVRVGDEVIVYLVGDANHERGIYIKLDGNENQCFQGVASRGTKSTCPLHKGQRIYTLLEENVFSIKERN